MKSYRLFLLLIFCGVFLVEASENYRIGFFWAWNNPNKLPSNLLWEQMDSLHCNYANFGRYNDARQLKDILNSAAKNNMKAQAEWKEFYATHYFSTRMVYFAGKWNDLRYFFDQNNPQSRTTGEEIFDSAVLQNLPDAIDIQKRNVIHCQPTQHSEGFITQHLIDDPYPENWIYQVRLDDRYHVKARLRISTSNNQPPSTEILHVACVERSSRKVVAEKTITLQDFSSFDPNQYHELELFSFQRPYLYKNRLSGEYAYNPSNPTNYERVQVTLDFIAYWNGQVETWFDYIKLDSDRSHQLFSGELDTKLLNSIASFKNHPALEHLLFKDEPEYGYFRPGNYLDKLLMASSGARGMSVNNKEGFNVEYVILEGLPEYVVDAYPIRGYQLPVPPEYAKDRRNVIDEQMVPEYTTEPAYNDSLQKAFNEYFFHEMDPAREASLKYDVPIWYCPQSFSMKIKGEDRLKYRCPTPEELEATVYLALAYGIKGLFYFRYTNSSEPNFYLGGVVNDQLRHTEQKGTTQWGETFYIGNDRLWETLLRLNPKAEKIMQVTQNLKSVAVFDEDNLQPPFRGISNWNRVLHGDIHFGTFKDTANDNYFMVVNKQCHPYAGQQFTLKLSLAPNSNYIISDILADSNFHIQSDASGKAVYNISIGPGKGLLYKISKL